MTISKPVISVKTLSTLLILSAGLCYGSAHAANSEDAASEEGVAFDISDRASSGDITEIIVNAERPARLVLDEAHAAQELAFSLFNELNSTDEFDISCREYTPTSTKLPVRVCEPRYFKTAQTQYAQDLIQIGAIQPPSERALWQELAPKTEQLNREMRELALEHPQLAEALLLYNEKLQEYEEMNKERGWLYRLLHRNE